jgi:hypothetical protein
MQEKQSSGKGAPSLGQSLPFVPVILSKVPRHSLAVSGFATAILCFSPSLRAFPIHPDPFVHLALAENETADGNIIFAVGKDFTRPQTGYSNFLDVANWTLKACADQ